MLAMQLWVVQIFVVAASNELKEAALVPSYKGCQAISGCSHPLSVHSMMACTPLTRLSLELG